MRFRTILAAVGIAAVLALGVPVAASASPQASAAIAHEAKAATIYPQSEVRVSCWDANTDAGWNWNGSGGAGSQMINSVGFASCVTQGGILVEFVWSPCTGGYCSMTEVSLDVAGIWQSTGYCGGWNQSQFRIVKQSCNGANYQYWAGTGTQPDLIWNWWYDTNHHTVCPYGGGYTQSVITDDSTSGPAYLSCPQGAGGQSYLSKQKWDIYQASI